MLQSSASLKIPGGSVEYAWFEPEKPQPGPVLTLLHEGLGCVELWRRFPQELANRTNLRVFAYSRFGYGRSDPCELPRPATYMHDEAREHLGSVLDGAGISETILVGHSDGASIAAIYAGSVSDARVKALVLMAPHFKCESRSLDGIRAARQAWDTTDLREKLRRYHGDNVDCAFLGWNSGWLEDEFADWNITDALDGIRVPVLAIQGKDDDYGTDWQVEIVAERLPGTNKVVLIDNCGHSPHQDQSERVLEEIEAFVSEYA